MSTTTDDPAVEAAARALAGGDCWSKFRGTVAGCEDKPCCCLRAMRAALVAAERAAWRGIETAPVGVELEWHGAIGGRPIRVCGDLGPTRQSIFVPTSYFPAALFTHWRPLPAPPDGGGA